MGKLIPLLEVRECRDDSFTEEPALILNSEAREGFDSEDPAKDTIPAKAQSCEKWGRASRAPV